MARTYERDVWLGALRGELGFGLPVTSHFALWLHAGASVPLSRPRFVIDDVRTIHRVNSLAGRVALEAEFSF